MTWESAMSEQFEDKVRAALALHDRDGDGNAAGLADGARARLRSRRRTTLTVMAAAVAVAAVPAVLAVIGPSRDATPSQGGPTASESPSPDTTQGPDPAPAGLRVESWRNLTVTVPDDWGYGGGTDWCAGGDHGEVPEVVRTDGAVRTIGCTPQNGYGVYFGDGSTIKFVYDSGHVWQYGWESPDQIKVYPEDAWLGFFQDGANYLMVVTPDEDTTRAVLASARVVQGRDPNGCAVRDGTDVAQGAGDRWSVCRYSGDGWLAQSELLTPEESQQLGTAVTSAPLKQGEVVPCASTPDLAGRIAVDSGSLLGGISIVFESWCPSNNGIFLSGAVRELTPDVLYWAISPGWSGGVDGSVPLPDQLRR
jgi:hypothetical protein